MDQARGGGDLGVPHCPHRTLNPSRWIDRDSIRNISTGNSVHILIGQLQ